MISSRDLLVRRRAPRRGGASLRAVGWSLVCVWATVGLLGCDGQAGAVPRDGQVGGASSEAVRVAVPALSFDGRVVPRSATELRAPQNVVKLSFWSNSSSWIKLVQLAPEGKEVKKGDVVGRFDFRGAQVKPRIRDMINEARASQTDVRLTQRQELERLTTQLQRQTLEASRAALDTKKEGLVSERNLSLFEMTHRQASFEVEATRQLIGVQRRLSGSEQAFAAEKLAQREAEMARFEAFRANFTVKAPHDGVVRHGYMRRRRRKVQKGDGMPAGYPFASLARDKVVAVEFFVPERHHDSVKVGDVVRVSLPASGAVVEAEVEKVEGFPQEMGFLRENEELPTAREKAYVVRARMTQESPEFKAGLEVKVTPP